MTEPKATEATAARRTCACGCGGQVVGAKARYLTGHDAKHKSALIRAALEAEAGGKRTSDAHKTLSALGWQSHLDKSRASRAAKAERKPKKAKPEAA